MMQFKGNMVLTLYIIFSLVILGFVFLYVGLMMLKHKQRFKKDCENRRIEEYKFDLYPLIRRRYEHRMNYIYFQIVDKVFGFISIAYSLFAFLVIAVETDVVTEFIIAFTTLISVFVALYITPRARVSEYDSSAKYLDAEFLKVCNVIAKRVNEGVSTDIIAAEVTESVALAIKNAEEIVKSDKQ